MQSLTAWASAHPTFMIVFFWPLVSLVISWLTRKRTEIEMQMMHPRVAALLKIVASLGIDGPKLLRSLQQLVSGAPVLLPGTRPITPDDVPTDPEVSPHQEIHS